MLSSTGEVLSYLQLNKLSVILSFQSGGQISTESRIDHLIGGELVSSYVAGSLPEHFTLFSLIESQISDMNIRDGELEIIFSPGDIVRIVRVDNVAEVAFINFPDSHQLVI